MLKLIMLACLGCVVAAPVYSQDFHLERITFRLDDGSYVDSLDSSTTVSGSMTINGTSVIRAEKMCISGICENYTDTLVLQSFSEKHSHALVRNYAGQQSLISVLNVEPLILLERSGGGVIVERWRQLGKQHYYGVFPALPEDGSTVLPMDEMLKGLSVFKRS